MAADAKPSKRKPARDIERKCSQDAYTHIWFQFKIKTQIYAYKINK